MHVFIYTASRGSIQFTGAKYSSNTLLIVNEAINLTKTSECVVWYTACDNLVLIGDQEFCQIIFWGCQKGTIVVKRLSLLQSVREDS